MKLRMIDRRDQTERGKVIRELYGKFYKATGLKHARLYSVLAEMWNIAYAQGQSRVTADASGAVRGEKASDGR